MKKLRSNKGFTLIELVVVMIILAILAAIVIPQMSNFSNAAETSACMANQRILDSTTAMWRAQDVKARNSTVEPSLSDMQPMLATAAFCPSGGTYTYKASRGLWECTIAAHERKATS